VFFPATEIFTCCVSYGRTGGKEVASLVLTGEMRLTQRNLDWQSLGDAELLAAAAGRNQQAFAVLIARHYQAVFRVAWRLSAGHVDAEDVTQEAFLKLWNNPSQLREAGALKGWLMRVASNMVMDRYRQKPMQELDAAAEISDSAPAASAMLDRNRVAGKIDAAIACLPDRQKLALTLVHFEHMTNITAAASMELSVDALESLLARARRKLKELLAQDGPHMLAALTQHGD
jgi:RNA polymerase sigma-70 factor, ECF subfamily